MRSLMLKLTIAFLLVSLTGTALVAVFVGQTTTAEFDRYVLEQMRSDFVAQASQYYQTNGSWEGVAEYFRRTEPLQPPPPQRPEDPPRSPPESQMPLSPGDNPFLLADQSGYTWVPAGRFGVGDQVPAAELAQGVVVKVDGKAVGTVVTVGPPPSRNARDVAYLARTYQALLIAALGATATALLLGILLARTLTRPLRELTAATRAMAKGKLKQQVSVRSQDELGELATAFNQMSADLARANQLRRQMTADIAHDLRTPLTVMTGYLESLRDGVLKPSTARFEVMYNEAQHLQRLVEDLRTLSLTDAGELLLHRQPVAPQALLEHGAAAFRHRAEQQNVTLQVNTDHGLPEINVDPERMAQVLGNLISNALRYTPEGGQITLSARQQADAVVLAVQDNGVGISPEALAHVFERFYRGDASRQQQDGESGLGLAIARSLVETHGGRITANSDGIGCGSTFSIYLPL